MITERNVQDVYERVANLVKCPNKLYEGLSFREVLDMLKNGADDVGFDSERLYNGMYCVNLVWENEVDNATYALAVVEDGETAEYMIDVICDLIRDMRKGI